MNKNLILVIGLAVLVVVLGTAAIFIKGAQKPLDNSAKSSSETKTKTSLKDLIVSGKSQKCVFVDKSDDVDVEGVAYIGNNKVRTDFNVDVGGEIATTHMIINDGKSYAWVNGQETGFIASFDPDEIKTASEGGESVDVDKIIAYNCTDWKFDNGYFTPSPEVKFKDVGKVAVPTGSQASGQSDKCSACDNLTGDLKTQCLSALSCN